jgi:hemoglobin
MTLFQQIGGFAQVRKIVSEFYDRIFESDELAAYFHHADMRRLIDHQTKFISSILGGPGSVSEDRLRRAHRPLGIAEHHFEEVLEILEETLEDFGLDRVHIDRVDVYVRSLRDLIVAAPAAAAS